MRQPRQARGIALDDLRLGEVATQEGGQFRIAFDQHQPSGRDAGGQQRLGDLACTGAQLHHVPRPPVQRVDRGARHRLGQQPATRNHRPHREGPAQPAFQEKGGAGA